MTLRPGLVEEYRRQREALLATYPELADDPIALRDTLEGESDVYEVIDALIRGAREDEAFAGANEDLADEYEKRKERCLARFQRRRSAVLALLCAIGERQVRRPDYTATVANGVQRVVVTDEAALPAQFVKETILRKPDKDAIKEALRTGEAVPGAMLSNGEPHLRVT